MQSSPPFRAAKVFDLSKAALTSHLFSAHFQLFLLGNFLPGIFSAQKTGFLLAPSILDKKTRLKTMFSCPKTNDETEVFLLENFGDRSENFFPLTLDLGFEVTVI